MTATVTSPPATITRPPAGFDPRTASADDLRAYNLPPCPDRDRCPDLYAFWRKMFKPPLNFLPYALTSPLKADARAGDNTRRQSSLNWSGAYIKPRNGKIFTEIHGSWQVPDIRPSAPPATTVSGRKEGVSTWIGLDGQRRYYHASLPQIGTLQSLPDENAPGGPSHYAWFQWWVDREGDDDPAPPPQTIRGFTVNPGDRIMCSLFVTDPSHVKFIIRNMDTGDIVVSSDIAAPEGQLGPLTVSGATAEWITERPSEWPDEGRRFNFANYGSVCFQDCLAVMTSPEGGDSEQRNLVGARLINMREARQNPLRTAKISVTCRPTSPHAFKTTYRESEV